MAEVIEAGEEASFVEVQDPIDVVLQGFTLDGRRKKKPKHPHHSAHRPATRHPVRPRHVSPAAAAAGFAAGRAGASESLEDGVPRDERGGAEEPLDAPSGDDGGGETPELEAPDDDDDVGALLAPDPAYARTDVVLALLGADDDINGFFDIIAAPFKAVVKVVTAPVHLLEKIPVIGGPIHAVVGASPLGLVEHIAKGERLDHALLNHFKDNIHAVHELAPYASTVVSFVPGIGTGVGAAIAAGAALAEGRSISDAAIAAVRGAIPGGQLVQGGFDAAVKVAQGQNVGKVALEAARDQLPSEARKAFDIGVAVMTGKSVQNAVIAAMGSLAPAQVKSILDAGAKVVKAPGLAAVAKGLPDAGARNGFTLAAGLLAHTGTTADVLNKARGKLQGSARVGFDALLHAQEKHFPAAAKALHGPSPQESVANAAAAIRYTDVVRKLPGGGVALLFPASMSATSAMIAADRALRVAEGSRGTPIQRKQMSDAIVATGKLAAQKNADAARTLSFMALAKTTRGVAGGKPVSHAAPKPREPKKPAPKPAATGAFVHSTGVIERGHWKQVEKGTKGALFGPMVDVSNRVTRGHFVRLS